VEIIVAAVVVIVPLLSTGVIPLSARMPQAVLQPIHVVRVTPVRDTSQTPQPDSTTSAPRRTEVVSMTNHPPLLPWGSNPNIPTNPIDEGTGNQICNHSDMPPNFAGSHAEVRQGPKRPIISVLSEAQLINRVEPVYPRPAILSGVQGEVKLHAIIARDGRVVSVSLISGHPLLARAAEEAVSQWRYRPYILNGEPVEVETFVTVHFTRDRQ